jgi:hypothetical protein
VYGYGPQQPAAAAASSHSHTVRQSAACKGGGRGGRDERRPPRGRCARSKQQQQASRREAGAGPHPSGTTTASAASMAMAIDTKAAVALGAAGAAAACFLCGRASPAVPMKADRLDQQQQQPPGEEPHPLGFTQHKEHPDSAFHKVLDLWGSNEERPSGTLSVQGLPSPLCHALCGWPQPRAQAFHPARAAVCVRAEKHDILTGMRARSHHITMHGEFAHSVLSRVANLGKGVWGALRCPLAPWLPPARCMAMTAVCPE